MSRLKPAERTERRVQMFIDRGIYKQKTDVLEAAMDLLVRQQMELDTKRQAETFKTDETSNHPRSRGVLLRLFDRYLLLLRNW